MRYKRRGPTTCKATKATLSACRDSTSPSPTALPFESPPTTRPGIDKAQSQDDQGSSLTFVDNSHHHASPTSRSPSAAPETAPIAEYQEWPFQGSLKRTRIGDDVTYNLEFKLPSISENFTYRLIPKHSISVLAKRLRRLQMFRPITRLLHIPRYIKHRCSLRRSGSVLNGQQKRMQRCSR